MKALALLIGSALLVYGIHFFGSSQVTVVLSGDERGYLSPCGCTAPMIGGIRRKASVIRALMRRGSTVLLENGGLVEAADRQDQLKAETIAQTISDLRVSAINLGPRDAQLGAPGVTQIAQLGSDRVVSLSVAGLEGVKRTIRSGPFLIGGATDAPVETAAALGARPVTLHDAVQGLVEEAAEQQAVPVLMLQGSRATAVSLARAFPTLGLIQYSSTGDPPTNLEVVGTTALATPGEHGKHIVTLGYEDGKFHDYRCIALGPEIRDDPTASRFYATYLRRVSEERLLNRWPRTSTESYAGSWSCVGCHKSAARAWKGSAHRSAFATLERDGHGSDPDCVRCHVVGLSSTRGFRSRLATPGLAEVGCESCHGPALAHVRNPSVSVKSADRETCVGCHNTLNSPNFDFTAYWPRIRH